MTRFFLILMGCFVLVAGQVRAAEEAGVLPADVREAMSFLVGEWTFTVVENGEEQQGHYAARWAEGGDCLHLTFRTPTHRDTGLGSWDPSTGELVENWYGPTAGRLEIRYQITSTTTWTGATRASKPDGKVVEGTCELQRTDANGFVYRGTSATETIHITNSRVLPAENSAAARVAVLKAFVGTWEANLPNGGTRQWSFGWSPEHLFLNNRMVSRDANGDPTFILNGTIGWDAANEQLTNWCVDALGEQMTFVWKATNTAQWNVSSPQNGATWEFTPTADTMTWVHSDERLTFKKR